MRFRVILRVVLG